MISATVYVTLAFEVIGHSVEGLESIARTDVEDMIVHSTGHGVEINDISVTNVQDDGE